MCQFRVNFTKLFHYKLKTQRVSSTFIRIVSAYSYPLTFSSKASTWVEILTATYEYDNPESCTFHRRCIWLILRTWKRFSAKERLIWFLLLLQMLCTISWFHSHCVCAWNKGLYFSVFLAKLRISSLLDSVDIRTSSFKPPLVTKSFELSAENRTQD